MFCLGASGFLPGWIFPHATLEINVAHFEELLVLPRWRSFSFCGDATAATAAAVILVQYPVWILH